MTSPVFKRDPPTFRQSRDPEHRTGRVVEAGRDHIRNAFVVPLGERQTAQLRDDHGTPEDLLIEAEEQTAEPDQAGPATLSDLHAIDPEVLQDVIELLPEFENDIVTQMLQGRSQVEIAAVYRVTQSGVSYRFQRALERLRWLLGPARWFGGQDVLDDEIPLLRAGLRVQEVRALAILWETTCYSEVARQLGLPVAERGRVVCLRGIDRLVVCSDPDVDLYRRGFVELVRWGVGKRMEGVNAWSRARIARQNLTSTGG